MDVKHPASLPRYPTGSKMSGGAYCICTLYSRLLRGPGIGIGPVVRPIINCLETVHVGEDRQAHIGQLRGCVI